MKKFIQVDGERVMLIHNMPFDPVNGMGKTEAELSQMGVLLEEVPEPVQREGLIPMPYYNAEQGFHYRYEPEPPKPATTEDIVKANTAVSSQVTDTQLALCEVYELLATLGGV